MAHSANQQFVANLKKARKEAGMSQEVLSVKAGLHRAYIHKLENGGRNPDLSELVKIARALGTTVSKLTEGVI